MQTKHLFLELQLLLTVEGKQKRYHFTNRSRNREYLSYILAGYESVLLDSTLVRIEDFQSERIGCCHLAFGPQKTRMLKYYQDHFEKSLSLNRQWSWQIHCRKPVTAFDIKVNGNFGGLPTPISYDKVLNLSVRKSCFKIHNTIERQERAVACIYPYPTLSFPCRKE